MVRGQTYLKSIGEINDVLRIIPKAYLFERAIELMGGGSSEWSIHGNGSPERSIYDIDMKTWEIESINGMLSTLIRIGYVKGDKLDPNSQIHDAVSAATRLEHTYASMLKRRFDKEPLLAAYIRCHIDDSDTESDRFNQTMMSILSHYPYKYSSQQVKDDIGEGLLSLIINVFDGQIDLKMFSDDIAIKIGFNQPHPIWVYPVGDFPEKRIASQQELEDMFLKHHVIYL